MPKRPKTPPPSRDEPWYFTIVNPYPYAGWHQAPYPEKKLFAQWVASFIGANWFLAWFEKPTEEEIIIEVARDFPRYELDRPLGEHRWSEFLKKPTKEQHNESSKVFFCTLNTYRAVKKNGWNKTDVQEAWFKGWDSYNNPLFVYPYPETPWCEIPLIRGEVIQKPLCRHLPKDMGEHAPVVQAPRAPPVGTAEWFAQKQTDKPTAASVWAKGPSTDAKAQPKERTSSTSNPTTPVSSTAPQANTKSDPWGSGWSTSVPPQQGGQPAFSPGLNTTTPNLWDVDGRGYAPLLDDSDDADSIDIVLSPMDPDDIDAAGDMESAMASLAFSGGPNKGANGGPSGENLWAEPAYDYTAPAPKEDLWGGYGSTEIVPQVKEDKILCKEHGERCSRGICAQYNKQKREAERKKKLAEDPAEKDNWRNKNQRKEKVHFVAPKNNGGVKKVDTPTRNRPAHLAGTSSPITPEADNEAPARPAASRPARGRHMNAAGSRANHSVPSPMSHTSPVSPQEQDDTKSVTASSTGGWGHPDSGPWGSVRAASVKGDDAKSVAASSTGGWGRPDPGPWANVPTASVKDDDARSVATTTGGWGHPEEGPWGAPKPAQSAAPKAKPSSSGPPGGAGSRPARGRKMNANNTDVNANTQNSTEATPLTASNLSAATTDTNTAPQKPKDVDVLSVATSTGGWGHPDEGPWAAVSKKKKGKKSVAGSSKNQTEFMKKSWADQMEDDDSQSVAGSVSGW